MNWLYWLQISYLQALATDCGKDFVFSFDFNNERSLFSRFGSPVAFRVSREATYADLFRTALFALRPQFRANVAAQVSGAFL